MFLTLKDALESLSRYFIQCLHNPCKCMIINEWIKVKDIVGKQDATCKCAFVI